MPPTLAVPRGQVSLCTSEFGIAQVDQLRPKPNGADCTSCNGDSCDDVGGSKHLSDPSMVAKTFEVTVHLLPVIAAQCNGRVQVDVIVNDFSLPPRERRGAIRRLVERPPQVFLETLFAAGQAYKPNGDHGNIVWNGRVVGEMTFIAESWLRNRARKLNRWLVAHGRANTTGHGIELEQVKHRVTVSSDDQLSYSVLDNLRLAGMNNVPLCTSILMAYFRSRMHARTIINVADYSWKCGYRSGAIAFQNAFHANTTIHNLFFFTTDDNYFVHDEIASSVPICCDS